MIWVKSIVARRTKLNFLVPKVLCLFFTCYAFRRVARWCCVDRKCALVTTTLSENTAPLINSSLHSFTVTIILFVCPLFGHHLVWKNNASCWSIMTAFGWMSEYKKCWLLFHPTGISCVMCSLEQHCTGDCVDLYIRLNMTILFLLLSPFWPLERFLWLVFSVYSGCYCGTV